MTKLLEQAIAKIRELSEEDQDAAAKAIIYYVSEIPDPEDATAITEGRDAYRRGDFASLDDWRHEMELGDH